MAVSIDDIKDEKSLEAWLNERPEAVRQNCAVFIAARSALRVMPVAVDGFQFGNAQIKSKIKTITILQSLLMAIRPAEKITRTFPAMAFSAPPTFGLGHPQSGYSAVAAFRSVMAAETSASEVTVVACHAVNAAYMGCSIVSVSLNSASEAFWLAVRRDCELWRDNARPDGFCRVDIAPLGLESVQFTPDWPVVREKLLNDSNSERGADWSFWVEWYDKILGGDPQDWDLLYEIAVSDDIDWKATPREVNDAIARIVEKHRRPQQALTAVASIEQVARTKAALSQNKAALPPTLDAIEFLISNEIKRLQEKNYADDIEMEESKRMISVFLQLLQATRGLAAKVPEDQASDEDAEEVISTLNMYKTLFSDWPRDNAPDVVDSACRIGVVGCVTGVFVMCGLPAGVGAAVAGAAFGGKKLADFAKSMVKSE